MRGWRTNSFGGGGDDGWVKVRLFSPTGDPSLGPERDFREIESPNGVCWCMTSPSHHQPENLDRSLWVDPSREPSGKPSGETLGGSSGKPSGDPRGSLGIDTTPLLPATSGPKMGDPHPPPHTGKGRKKGRKRGGYTHYFLNFSLGENPHTPPQLARRGRPAVGGKDKRGGARVWRAGRTKSIDLIETSSMELVSHSYLASLRSYNAPKFTPFPGVIRLYWWGKQG